MVALVTAVKLGLLYSKVYALRSWATVAKTTACFPGCQEAPRRFSGPERCSEQTPVSTLDLSHKQEVAQHAGGAAVCSAHWASTLFNSEESVTSLLPRLRLVLLQTFSSSLITYWEWNIFSLMLNEGLGHCPCPCPRPSWLSTCYRHRTGF